MFHVICDFVQSGGGILNKRVCNTLHGSGGRILNKRVCNTLHGSGGRILNKRVCNTLHGSGGRILNKRVCNTLHGNAFFLVAEWPVIPWPRMRSAYTCSCKSQSSIKITSQERFAPTRTPPHHSLCQAGVVH